MESQVWVEAKDGFITARLQGVLGEALLRECQERVLGLVRSTGHGRILYDTRELLSVTPMHRRPGSEPLPGVVLRRAIVVAPDARLAYQVRLAFGDGYYRIFNGDISAASTWLEQVLPSPVPERPGKANRDKLWQRPTMPSDLAPLADTPPQLLQDMPRRTLRG